MNLCFQIFCIRVSARLTLRLTLHDNKLRHITLVVIPHLVISMSGQRELNFGVIWRFIYMAYQMSVFIKGSFPSKVVFHQRSSSFKGRLSTKFVFGQRLFSVKGCLLSKVKGQRSFSIKGHLLSKVVFRQRLSSIKDRLLSKVVFRQMLSSIKVCLPSKVFLH